MKPPTFRLWRAAPLRPQIAWLSVLLPAFNAVDSSAATKETVAVVHERVSPPGRGAEIGYYGTSPESPDGSKIAYVAYDDKLGPESAADSRGSLYLCDADLTNHVKVRDIESIHWEDGARQIWLTNDTIAYMDYLPGRGPATYVVNTSGEVVRGPLEGGLGQGETPNGSVLLWVDKKYFPHGSSLGPSGIYIYNDGVVTQAVDLERDFGPLKDRLEGSDNPGDWFMFHPQLSLHGTHIQVRLDSEYRVRQYLVTCRSDGTDARLFEAPKKPLHQQWYDDSTIFGQEWVSRPADGGPRFQAKRWDRDGNYMETLAGAGNHSGISPDRRYIASDNHYGLDPVVISLYETRRAEPLAVLMSEPEGPVWKMRAHVNPAFSRDGRKVYFNKPVNGMPGVYRVDISRVIAARR